MSTVLSSVGRHEGIHRPNGVLRKKRVQSIDVLRGCVMLLMVIDHVRNYFHADAFRFDPTDLEKTNTMLFFTRWITHYCAPVFVFLSGMSANLSGMRRSKRQLSFFLFTRGLWLVCAEMLIISLAWTFNPAYPFVNLQVIWAIGMSMMALSALVYLDKRVILGIGIIVVAGHNMLDGIQVEGGGPGAMLWSALHEPGVFGIGGRTFQIRYPVLPWIGIMAVGYYCGTFYSSRYDSEFRRTHFMMAGVLVVAFFVFLRSVNYYGDPSPWMPQSTQMLTFLSYINVTKYPPSLLYALMTIGPALIFLAFAERELNGVTLRLAVIGRVPMFYYVLHIFLIHFLAMLAAVVTGFEWSVMILEGRVGRAAGLKGYGFDLLTVYSVSVIVVCVLYPLCRWFDNYKRKHSGRVWLSYV